MTISDQTRHQLYRRLEEVLGADEATTLMEHLPPVGWADVATKRDLDHLSVITKRDLDQLAATTKQDLDQLAATTKHDLDQLQSSMKVEFAKAWGEFGHVRADIAGVRAEVHQEVGKLRGDLRGQNQTLFLGLVGLQMTGATLAVALSRLL